MGEGLVIQPQMFLQACLLGVGLGFLYDLFRVFKLATNSKKNSIFIQDVLYFILGAVITFLFMLITNSGNIRFYTIAGEIIGACVYFMLFSWAFMRFSTFIVNVLKKIGFNTYTFAFVPVVSFFKKIYVTLLEFFRKKIKFTKI